MSSSLLRQKIEQLWNSQNQEREVLLQEIANLTESEELSPIEVFMHLGFEALKGGNFSLGHHLGDEVISLCERNVNQHMLAEAYRLKAYLHFMEEEWATSLEFFHKSLQIKIIDKDQRGIAEISLWAGNVCSRAMGKMLAVQFFKQAAKIYLDIGDTGSAGEAYFETGREYLNAGYFQVAIEYFNQAKKLAIQSKQSELQAQAIRLANVTENNLEKFHQEFQVQQLQTILGSEEGILFKKPLITHDEGGGAKIIELKYEASDIGENFHYSLMEASYLERSYSFFASLEDIQGMAFCLFYQGQYYHNLDLYPVALRFYREALDLIKGLSNYSFAKAAIYEKVGVIYLSTGRYRDAIEYNLKAAELDQQVKDVEGEAMCYTNIGISLLHLGELYQSIEFHQRALSLSEWQKAKGYTNLGNAYRILRDYSQARDNYQKALKEFESRMDHFGIARSYGNLALLADKEGNFEEAVEYNQRALSWAETWGGDTTIQSKCHLNLGNLYLLHNELASAISHAQSAQEAAQQIDHLELQRAALMIQAHALAIQDNLLDAYSKAEDALSLAQVYGSTIEEESFKLNFSDQLASDYQFMIDLCLRLSKFEDAYHYVEKSKSQALIDLLSVTNFSPSVEINSQMKELLAEESACLAKLSQVRTSSMRKRGVVFAPGEIESIRIRLQRVYSELSAYDPEYVFCRCREALSHTEIRKIFANRPSRTALIEYFISNEDIYIFIIDAEGHLYVEKVPQERERFELLLENYNREVLNYQPSDFVMNTWQELGVYLLDPVGKYLQHGDHLYLVPHGFLHFLPLHALKLNGEILIRHHTVAYAPSASVLKFLVQKGSGRLEKCIAFGVALNKEEERDLPRMPIEQRTKAQEMCKIFEREAHDASSLFKGQCFTASQVTQEKVWQNCLDKDLVHFSCHGMFNAENPMESGLKLYDGNLTAKQIFNLKLNAEIVVLSACQTGINWRRAGDDLLGLTRSFLYAGAASLLVSLWSVNSTSTYELMVDFYQRLQQGEDKAVALREAQLHLIEKYDNPFYWAPFILVGDWKT